MSVLLTPKGSFSDSKDMHSVAEITLWNPRVLTEKKKNHCPSPCPLGLTFFTCIMKSVVTIGITSSRKLKVHFPGSSSILHPLSAIKR